MPKQPLKKSSEMDLGGKLPGGTSKEYQTGGWRNQMPVLNRDKCVNSLNCASICPENCIKVKDGQITHFDMRYCKGCGLCAKECPTGAIEMKDL